MKYLLHLFLFLALPTLLFLSFKIETSESNCVQAFETLKKLTKNEDFADAKPFALITIECLESNDSKDTLMLIEANYLLGQIYRTAYQQDSFRYYNELALSLSQKALPDTNLLYLNCLHKQGWIAYQDGDNERTLEIYDQVDSLFNITGRKNFELNSKLLLYYSVHFDATKDYETAIDYALQGVDLCNKTATTESDKRIFEFYSSLGALEGYKGNMFKSLEFAQEALVHFEKHHSKEHPYAPRIYNNTANAYLRLNNNTQAVQYLEKAYEAFILHNPADKPPVGSILNNMGKAYFNLGDIDKAIELFRNVLTIRKNAYGDEHIRTAVSKLQLAGMYIEREQPDLAVVLIKECIVTFTNLVGPTHPILDQCYNNLAVAYRFLGEYDKAHESYQSSLSILSENHPQGHYAYANTFENIGHLFVFEEKYDRAIEWLEKALDIVKESSGIESIQSAKFHSVLANAIAKSGNREKAWEHYSLSLDIFNIQKEKETDFSLIEDRKTLLGIFNNIIHYYWGSYELEANKVYLTSIVSYSKLAIKLLDYQRQSLGAETTRELMTHKNFYLYESIIKANLFLYEIDQNQAYLDESERYIEMSKSNSLLDAMRQSGASTFANISGETLKEGSNFRNSINFLEKQIYESKGDSIRKPLQNELFELKRSYERYQKDLKDKHPEYFALQNQNKWASLSSVSSELQDGTVLLEFFLGEDIIVVFGIANGQYFHEWQEISPGFNEKLNGLLGELRTPPTSATIDSRLDSFIEKSNEIYEVVFQPIQHLLAPETKHLVIIPDGALAYLPFELLITSKEAPLHSFKELPYLLHEYSFSYAPSISVWEEMQQKKIKSKGCLVMAPDFPAIDSVWSSEMAARRNDLGPLQFNKQEASSIQALGRGIGFFGNEASLANFNKYNNKADILHFATHAKVEERQNRYSFLAFSGSGEQKDSSKLYLADLYNMELAANMVVLSACETGLGKLRRGEGILSLARGFTYAGAKSIVTSLWSVNDLATANLMEDFYQQLDNGSSKDKALRTSKLSYLTAQKNELNSHPYYWGAFVAIGDMEPVDLDGRNTFWWILIAILLGAGLIIYQRKGQ